MPNADFTVHASSTLIRVDRTWIIHIHSRLIGAWMDGNPHVDDPGQSNWFNARIA